MGPESGIGRMKNVCLGDICPGNIVPQNISAVANLIMKRYKVLENLNHIFSSVVNSTMRSFKV